MRKFCLILIAILVTAGCTPPAGPPLPEGGLTRAEFITVMQALALSEPGMRAELLDRHRTSEAEIRAFIDAMAADPLLLSATLDSVQNGVERSRMLKPVKTID